MSIKIPQLLFLIFAAIAIYFYKSSILVSSAPRNFGQSVYVSQFSSRGIVDRTIILKIKSNPIKNSESVEVVAYVSMPFDFDGQLNYKWTLGQNVQVVEGDLTGSTESSFQREIPKKITLLVNGFNPLELRHIGFEVWGEKNGRRLFADGLISSQQKNSFEDIVQHVEKLKVEKQGKHK